MEEAMKAMATVNVEDLSHDLRPFLVVYKDGRVQRFTGTQRVPPSTDTDTETGVESLDVAVRPEEEGGVSVRLYKPAGGDRGRLPVLIYIHGGGFCIESAASPLYHNYLNGLCSKANVLVVSVDYRLAPEHPLPAAYDDSWAAINWVGNGYGQDVHPWIKDHADLSRVFLAGDSAGANIAHHMAKRLGKEKIQNLRLKLKAVLLVHPFFWGKDRIGSELQKINASGGGLADKLWEFICPGTSGSDDPLINPATDPELADLAVEKVMVYVAEQDTLRDRGFHYKEVLLKSGCKANVEVVETLGENHVFHLLNPGSPNAAPFMDQVVSFLNSS